MDYMLWELPISILNQGIHSYLCDAGAKVKRTSRANDDEFGQIAKMLGL